MRGDLAKTVCLDGKKLKKNVSATSWVWVQSSSKREFLPYTRCKISFTIYAFSVIMNEMNLARSHDIVPSISHQTPHVVSFFKKTR